MHLRPVHGRLEEEGVVAVSPLFQIDLSEREDGYGYIYGRARLGDRSASLNILPPAPFRGDVVIETPHPTNYRIFVDGVELESVDRPEKVRDVVKDYMERLK